MASQCRGLHFLQSLCELIAVSRQIGTGVTKQFRPGMLTRPAMDEAKAQAEANAKFAITVA